MLYFKFYEHSPCLQRDFPQPTQFYNDDDHFFKFRTTVFVDIMLQYFLQLRRLTMIMPLLAVNLVSSLSNSKGLRFFYIRWLHYFLTWSYFDFQNSCYRTTILLSVSAKLVLSQAAPLGYFFSVSDGAALLDGELFFVMWLPDDEVHINKYQNNLSTGLQPWIKYFIKSKGIKQN